MIEKFYNPSSLYLFMKKIFKLIISILIPLAIGFVGSFFTSSSVDNWYQTIAKPQFNPPNFVFAPVWTILFILIGLSFYFVWTKNFAKQKNKAIGIFSIQLFLNLLWSLLFFGLQNPLFGFLDIVLLEIVIIFNIKIFYKINKISAYLLIPYLIWVSFALILNASIVILN